MCSSTYRKYGYNFQLIDHGRITNYTILFSVILALFAYRVIFKYFQIQDGELGLFQTGLKVSKFRLKKKIKFHRIIWIEKVVQRIIIPP